MEHTHQHQRNPRKGNVMCIMQVCLGPYFDLKDVTEEKEARIRAAKSKQQILRLEIIMRSNTCLYLMTYKMQHTEFI